jgi:hypothetical protein
VFRRSATWPDAAWPVTRKPIASGTTWQAARKALEIFAWITDGTIAR